MPEELYKKISLRTSPTATPESRFVGVNDTIATILREYGVNADKHDVTVGGESVELSFVPANGAEIVLSTKKYSSGQFWPAF